MTLRTMHEFGILPEGIWPAGGGHAHFWERALSRREVLKGSAGAAALLAAGAFAPGLAKATTGNAAPKPIPGGLGPFWHVNLNAYVGGVLLEQSTITDFKGVFGSCDVTGWGRDNRGTELYFDSDMRFMQGRYVAQDGVERQATFAFI